MIRLGGRWTPPDRAEKVWHELEFEVPDRAAGVRIELEYPAAGGVLDLGLVDPLGWRGWSGGARSLVEIAPDRATPGYLDRGVPPGRWAVVLGLHRLPHEGLPWTVTIRTDSATGRSERQLPPVPERRTRRALPADDGRVWLAGDLHAHTEHSDGVLSIDELAVRAVAAGLDFLAVTDHNTVSHHALLPAAGARAGLVLLPGQEVTTADGHANAYGDIGWVDFRESAASWQAVVAARSGLLSVNHPVSGDCAWRHQLPERPALAEVWHSSWRDRRDGGPLAWWAATGLAPNPIGGSDFHRPGSDAPVGSPTTWVLARDGDVLGGLAAGLTAVSAGRNGPLLLRDAGELLALDADGTQLVCLSDGRRTPVRGDRMTIPSHGRRHALETNDRTVVGVSA